MLATRRVRQLRNKIEAQDAPGVVETLSSEFESSFSSATIAGYVDDLLAEFEDARVREFVPLLVYRLTRERLLDACRAGK
jgi:hypothetical protein